MKNIGNEAFMGCKALKEITLPDSITTIGDKAFQYAGLTKLTLPKGLKTIGAQAFYECKSLHKTAIPEGVTSVGRSAFSGCAALECVYLPRSLTRIEAYTFEYCKYMEVCYGGSEAMWNQISIEGYTERGANKILYNAPKHFNCQPSDINKYARF